MTNQEAIRLIRNLPTMCEFTDAYGEPIDSDTYYEAVDMAISALQEQELSETKKALDSVSRKAAIDELKRISFSHRFECGEYLSEDTREIEIIIRSKALAAIEALPSAQSEPHWIPVISPKVSGKYLVTHGGSYILSLDTYTTTEDAVRIFDEGYEDYVGWQSQNVIAWMPLPEPYRAERRTDDKA